MKLQQGKFADAKLRFEAKYLDTLLRRFSTLREAAKAAGMDHSTLWRKLRKHGYRPTPAMWERSGNRPAIRRQRRSSEGRE